MDYCVDGVCDRDGCGCEYIPVVEDGGEGTSDVGSVIVYWVVDVAEYHKFGDGGGF